jgi:TolB-like protein/tRNA A-37 threonylcarbamoyl transferase component Bud32/tetratricopeptide (TPR) repeat protein
MHDVRSRLEATLGDGYTIERELGGGGMSRVFLATERALDRPVVIKLLSPELAATVSARRFEREIRVAAALQQANIVPLLVTGECDGLPFYTMPYVEGSSLRQRLNDGPALTIGEIVGVLRDVARALAFAHEHGVVHRDIKPENVLFSGDTVVVTDFGIAKALDSARDGDSSGVITATTLTATGVTIGTLAYMAPEQCAGDSDADHRVDIYGFGCVAYELLTGQSPFGHRPARQLVAAHLGESPMPVDERRADTPPEMAKLVMRCLAKDPGARPASAREALRALESVTASVTAGARLRLRMSHRRNALAVGGVLALAAATAVWAAWPAPAPAAIAVIPFLNVDGDTAEEYVAEGLADGLANALGRVPRLRVIARTMSYRFRGRRDLDLRAVGESLSASHVVLGRVRRARGHMIVSAQLTRTSDNSEIWSRTFDREDREAPRLQDDIARGIVESLGIVATTVASSGTDVVQAGRPSSSGTTNGEALDLYWRGRFLLQRRGAGVEQSIRNFEQAIALDSGFARAHAALALALELRVFFDAVDLADTHRRSMAAASRALRVDSTLAGAHIARALAHQAAFRWSDAEAELRTALASDSTEPDAHIQYGRLLFYTGRMREARREYERARALDPLSAVASAWVGHVLELTGRTDSAIVELRRALQTDSTNPLALTMMSQAMLQAGRVPEAIAYARKLYDRVTTWRGVALSLVAFAGDTVGLRQVLRDIESGRLPGGLYDRYGGYGSPAIYIALGDTARALEVLERVTDQGVNWAVNSCACERSFDPIRGSPRFAALLRRIGLPVEVFTSASGGRSP